MTTTPAEQRAELGIPSDTFANRLLLARAHRGLTIGEAAEKCALNYGSWSNWERGMEPRKLREVVEKVSAGLSIDRDWLMWGGALSANRAGGDSTQYRAYPDQPDLRDNRMRRAHPVGALVDPPGRVDSRLPGRQSIDATGLLNQIAV